MTFAEIQAQERALTMLRAARAQGRLAHAYLFVGPEGVGKEATALALARELLCEDTPEKCAPCAPCRKVEARVHPDVHLVVPENDVLPIDALRKLAARLQLTPFEGKVKFAVLRDSHAMSPAAQNALLKTLEEPPGSAVLVLCTSAPHLLLPTVRSRCQRVPFGPLPDGFVRARVAAATGRPPDDPDVHLAVALAEGSLGRALAVAAQGLYAERRELLSAVQSLRSDAPGAALDLAEAWGNDRARAAEAIEILQLWYRDHLLDAVGDPRPRCLPDFRPTRPLATETALAALERLHEARRGLVGYASAQLTLERTFLRIAEEVAG